LRCALHRQLDGVEQASGITIGDVHQMFDRFIADLHLSLAIAPFLVMEGSQ